MPPGNNSQIAIPVVASHDLGTTFKKNHVQGLKIDVNVDKNTLVIEQDGTIKINTQVGEAESSALKDLIKAQQSITNLTLDEENNQLVFINETGQQTIINLPSGEPNLPDFTDTYTISKGNLI